MAAGSLITSPFLSSSSVQTASGKMMRRSGVKVAHFAAIDSQLWVDEWRRIHPVKPQQCVADMLDAPVRTVEKWFNGSARPSFDWWGPIMHSYGPEFFAAGMHTPPEWLDNAARLERKQRLLQQKADIDARLALEMVAGALP